MAEPDTKEPDKRAAAKKQVMRNFRSPVVRSNFGRFDVLETELYPIETYSTKFMSAADQITLAVDKVDVPEVKMTLSPVPAHTRFYADPNAEVYDYEARLSLNDGDREAFSVLASAFSEGMMRKFTMEGSSSFLIAYGKNVIDGVLFVFDLYRPGREDAPTVSATVSMTTSKAACSPYTDQTVWEYLVTMHQQDTEKPKDAEVKAVYGELREFMRAAIASLGVFPSKL